jgi:hypothetical protein
MLSRPDGDSRKPNYSLLRNRISYICQEMGTLRSILLYRYTHLDRLLQLVLGKGPCDHAYSLSSIRGYGEDLAHRSALDNTDSCAWFVTGLRWTTKCNRSFNHHCIS